MQNVATKMKLRNGANLVDVTNAHNYMTILIKIVKESILSPKKLDVECTSFLEEVEHALAGAKQKVTFLEASLENHKENMNGNRESFKSSFAEVSHISK